MALASHEAALEQFKANTDWKATGSVTKARLAHEALYFLVVLRAQKQSLDGHSFEYESLKPFLEEVEAWLATNDPTNQPTAHFTIGRPLS